MTSRRLPGWARLLLVAGGVCAAALLSLVLWFVVAFSGGLDDVLDVTEPSPEDAEVVEAQERSEERLAHDLREVTGAEPSAARSTCEQGQHNWKVDDPYDLLCTQGSAGTLALGEGPDTRRALLDLHDRLVADGWSHSGSDAGLEDRSSLARMVDEYGVEAMPAATYRRDGVELVVETARRGDPAPYGWPGDALPVPQDGLVALVVLREEYFSG